MIFTRGAISPGVIARGLIGAAILVAHGAFAQSPFPDRPPRLIVPFAAGGSSDVVGRVLAEKMRDDLGQTVIVENRPGAGGQIAVTALKAAAADGGTILLANDHQAAIIPLTMKSAGYDPFKDLSPIGMTATSGE